MNNRREVFESIYEGNLWSGAESRSGTGSDSNQTVLVRRELPKLLAQLKTKVFLDIPCGDMNWMKQITLPMTVKYIGADIVPAIIEENQKLYPNREFQVLDLVKDKLPTADVVFVRDCLGHLNHEEIIAAIWNIKQSGARYLISTTFPHIKDNPRTPTGSWKPINLEHYRLKPVMLIGEGLKDERGVDVGKCLGVYRLR